MNPRCRQDPAPHFARRTGRRTTLLWLAPLCLLVALPTWSTEPAERWESFRGDPQLTGRATSELADNLQPQWTLQDEDGFEATAAIGNGMVFIGSLGGRFRALDLETGDEVWQFASEWEIKSSALIEGDTVFYGDEEGVLRALELSTGQARWQFATDAGITSSPNKAGPCLLFGSYDNYLYCLDPAT